MFVRNLTKNVFKVAAIAALLSLAGCGDDSKKKRSGSKSPSTQVREPITTDPNNPGYNPNTPTTVPDSDWAGCGKDHYCDKGDGKISLPSSSSSLIGGYNAEDLRACMKVAAANSIRTYGPWVIDSASRQFNILGQEISIDTGSNAFVNGNYARIMMLNVTSIASTGTIQLMDPNTVYCVKASSYFSAPTFRSCYPNNVVFLKDNSWLAANKYVVPMSCGTVPVWDQRYK